MDYTAQSLTFKLRKALRYVRLYGPARTIAKIKGQYHSRREYAKLPAPNGDGGQQGHVGLIGCGNFAYSNIAYYLRKNYGGVIRACCDTNIHRAASLHNEYRLAYYTDDAERILDDPAIDTYFVASNHASHTPYAIGALERGKNVHIEKPHCVSPEQLEQLVTAMQNSSGKILSIGYNRPLSRIGETIREHLARESGESMQNWFVAGHELEPDHWYFSPEEGGRVLGNLCHWIDFVYEMVPPADRYPIRITPTRSERSDCDIGVTYVFGDGSIAAITFSAKGHTFEGVRERYAAHRGNTLIAMDDFKDLTIDVVAQRRRPRQLFRDHGHEASIVRSYERALDEDPDNACSVQHVAEVGRLFLRTREALESDKILDERAYSDARER